jgi:putative ABC transport system ATP-binding protein
MTIQSVTNKRILSIESLSQEIIQGGVHRLLLDHVSLEVRVHEVVAVVGRSGAGKSTLLNCIAGFTPFMNGTIKIGETSISRGIDRELSEMRLRKLGIVFQFFNLLPSLTLLQNVILPLRLAGIPYKDAMVQGRSACELVEIRHCMDQLPSQVSGGEAQRAAIARSFINNPVLILADEPTGNLDIESGKVVMELLSSIVRDRACGMLLVSHDADTVRYADRIVTLCNGVLCNGVLS